MRTNKWMQELLQQYEIGEDYVQALGPELKALLDPGFLVRDGAYLLARLESTVTQPPEWFEDLVGYECAVNHFHVEDRLGPRVKRSTETLLRSGVAFVHELEKELLVTFPGVPFWIILSYTDEPLISCTIRFHKIRPGQEWLVLDDLDGYKTDAVMVLSVSEEQAG